jgi:hypothetical protein
MSKNWKKAGSSICVVVLAIAGASCNKASSPIGTEDKTGLTQEETALRERTRQIATETLGLVLTGKTESGHSTNFSGLRTETLTFTQRLDSRTYVAYDRRFSQVKEKGIYKEPDEGLLKRSAELLERLKVPRNEVETEKVLQEKTQVGERNAKSRKLRLEDVEMGKKYALTTRQIAGVPVFSSRAMIGLMPGGEIGFLEVHWPEIPAKVAEEGRRYRKIVEERNWRAPERKGARVESVTAGILHSPAAGTAMDSYAVIRVIYAPLDKRLGKKPVGYFDAEGKPITMPRTLLQPPREELKTERPAATK